MMRNRTLEAFGVLVGDWTTTWTQALLPGRMLAAEPSFEWMEGGALLVMRTRMDAPEIPTGVAIIGSDDAAGRAFIFCRGERGVSRKHDTRMDGDTWQWWRDGPGFSQRYAVTIEADGRALVGKGELSKDGTTWGKDLDLTCARVPGKAGRQTRAG